MRLLALLLAACGTPHPIDDDGSGTLPVDTDDTAADTDPDTDSGDTDTAEPDTDTAPVDTDTGPDTDTVDTDTAPMDTAPVDTGDPAPPTATDCFAAQWGDAPPVDYDQFTPVLGAHCLGTDHQEITGVERVVFVGDSITVGTPPTATEDWYRNVVADELAAKFGLEAPDWGWENVNLIDGVVYTQLSGDFASCAKWGARTDDLLLEPHMQLETCIPEEDRHLVTLVVMTSGGNDIDSLLDDVVEGQDEATLRANFAEATALLREAAEWVADPTRFPNGAYLVFANTYDFTDPDSAEDMASCPGAGLIGLDEPLRDPVLQSVLADAAEEYMSIAVDTQTDMVFLGEQFCGHGYNDDPASRCYRGDGELWLDPTCMHPSDLGHAAIAEMVLAVVDE